MKVPEPKKLPSGSWRIQMRLDGKSVSITEATAKECKRKAALVKAEYMNGKTVISKTDITASEAIDQYIQKHKELSVSTVRGYRIVQKHRFPKYIDKPMAKVNWKEACLEEQQNVSPKTLKNAYSLIKTMMKENKIPIDDEVKLPRNEKNKRPYLTHDQIDTFVDAVKDKSFAAPALLALHSLRRSEIYNLTWDKIDLKNDTITVKGAMVIDENNQYVRQDRNKTVASTRIIPIMIPELKTALINLNGAPLTTGCPTTLYKQVNRLCEQLDLPQVGVHGLRHSFASLAHYLGVPAEECAVLGGWDDLNTMREIYTHIEEDELSRESKKMAAYYKGRLERAEKQKKKENAHENAHAD